MTRAPLWIAAVAATLVGAACRPSPGTHGPAAVDDRQLRVAIAGAEARREAGTADLIQRARRGATPGRVLAIRALGRIGDPRALAALRELLTAASSDHGVVAASASALALAASLDDPPPSPALTAELVAAMARVDDAHRPQVIEAIGRAADASAQGALIPLLDGAPADAVVAALAFARFGRRKIELDPTARIGLIRMTERDVPLAYAAVHALAREHVPPPTAASAASVVAARQRLAPALIARLGDDDAEIRTQATLAVARQQLVSTAHAELERNLLDRDWRVAVETVRALAGEHGDDAGRDAVAAALVRRFDELERGVATEAQVVIEGLRVLGPHAVRRGVAAAISTIATRAAASTTVTGVAHAWIGCLAAAGQIRASQAPDLTWVDQCKLPDHLRLPLIAELAVAGVGPSAARRRVVARMLVHHDHRVRAAALGALVALWADGGASDHEATIATLVASIGAADPVIAGAAIEAITTLYDRLDPSGRAVIDQAIVGRAGRERDPELASSLLALIGTRAITSGVGACRHGLRAHPAVRGAARDCLRALGEPSARPAAVASTPPPVEVREVIGHTVLWSLTTTQGPITIALRPEVAPWAVATIVHLTRAGFYDGLELHRVVPGFVAQGGDPTMSGWGGPGFVLPAEPGSLADGPGFAAGGIGIADAGRDSGGSQWFVMHARAPHLDGRYTWVGTIRTGQKSADALLIGDKIETATVIVDP